MLNEETKARNRKQRKTDQARVGIVDKQTGEVLDDGDLIYVPKRLRIKGFFMAMQDGFEHIAKKKLNGQALNVLMLLMSRMDYENAVFMTQKEVGKLLDMQPANVSRAIRELKAAGVLESQPNAKRAIYLECGIGWKGRVASLREKNRSLLKDQTTIQH